LFWIARREWDFSDVQKGLEIDMYRLINVKYGFGTMFVNRKCMLILLWIIGSCHTAKF